MQRLLELDIYSPIQIKTPASFFADVETIGLDILGRDYENLLRYSGGDTTIPRENGLSVTSAEKLRYFYASRVAPHSPSRVLELMQSASMLFAERRLAGSIGGEDVIEPMNRELTLAGEKVFCETFDYIDIVMSARYPDMRIFTLKQLPGKESKLNRMSKIANDIIDQQAIPLFSDKNMPRTLAQHAIAYSVPFARTKATNLSESKLQEALDAMTTNSLEVNVLAIVGPVEHSVGEN